MLRVVSPHPFPVLPIPWESTSGQPMLTVVVKATFRLAPGSEASLEGAQDALSGDQPWDSDARASLFRPTDWAPFKPRSEVLLVGHAHAPRGAPVEALIARLACGGVDKLVRVVGNRSTPDARPMPFSKVPLREERAARTAENPRGTLGAPSLLPVQPGAWPTFGPLHPQSPTRRGSLDEAAFQWAYRLSGPMPRGFDGAFFNVAPAEQRVAEIPLGGGLVLENLHPEHPSLTARLPGARPRAALDGRDVALVADTLWIDSDRGVAVITWRGSIDVTERATAEGTLEIALDRPAEAAPPIAPSPTRPAKSPLLASFARTVAADSDAPARPATPFEQQGSPPAADKAPPALDLKSTIEAPPARAPAPATPFVQGTSSLASERRSRPAVRKDFTGTMLPMEEPKAPLPFPSTGAPPARPLAIPPPIAPPPPVVTEAPRALADEPRAAPRDPRTTPLPVAAYAAIKAELWAGATGRREALARHGFDEGSWQREERLQTEAIAAEASAGRGERALALMTALEGVEAPPRELGLDRYVAIRVRLEQAGDARGAVLDEEGLTPAEWDSAHRGYLRRVRGDAELRDRLSATLYAARAGSLARG